MKKQLDTDKSDQSKAVALRDQLEAKIKELKAEIGKHEFALEQIDRLIGTKGNAETSNPQLTPPTKKLPQKLALSPLRTPVRPPVQTGSQLQAKKRSATKKATKKRGKKKSETP
jgi:hypothetical protein